MKYEVRGGVMVPVKPIGKVKTHSAMIRELLEKAQRELTEAKTDMERLIAQVHGLEETVKSQKSFIKEQDKELERLRKKLAFKPKKKKGKPRKTQTEEKVIEEKEVSAED